MKVCMAYKATKSLVDGKHVRDGRLYCELKEGHTGPHKTHVPFDDKVMLFPNEENP